MKSLSEDVDVRKYISDDKGQVKEGHSMHMKKIVE